MQEQDQEVKDPDVDGRYSWPLPGSWGYDPYYLQSFPFAQPNQFWQGQSRGPTTSTLTRRCQNELESFSPHSPLSTPGSPAHSHSCSPTVIESSSTDEGGVVTSKQVSLYSMASSGH